MNLSTKLRLSLLVLGICLLVGLIGWAALTTREQVMEIEERFDTVQRESFIMAENARARVEELNTYLLTFRSTRDTNVWEQFTRTNRLFSAELKSGMVMLTTARENTLLHRIQLLYDNYLEEADAFGSAVQAADSAEEAAAVSFGSVLAYSDQITAVARRMADAHRDALQLIFLDSRHSLEEMSWLIFGALTLLLGIGLWLALIVYRELLAPLQVKLVESRAIIEQKEKLAALGVLAAGVAHEIRNPLTAIKARLFILQKNIGKASAGYDDSTIINNEIQRLERIVKDFMQFANPADPRSVAVTAEEPLRAVAELLEPELAASQIQLKLDIQTREQVAIDPQQMKQVLLNLVQNAAESIGRNGSITLRSRVDERKLRGQNQRVVILEVEDNGHGIPPEVQRRLFDPFFSTKDTGTGLGLSIAVRIVEKHQGALEFQTQINRGTTFGIILPLTAAKPNDKHVESIAHRG